MITRVVPWFSKEEFTEVFEHLQSLDVKRWKKARDSILVWQARVYKLHAAIDITLPLLQAKVMTADSHVDDSVKSVFLATAVQRFVTAVLKLPQTKYYQTKSMHFLAMDIGLPMHLVDIRNEVVHGHGGWSGGPTIEHAVQSCLLWVMSYYWIPEYQKLVCNEEMEPEFPEEDWQSFMAHLNKYGEHLMLESRKRKKSLACAKACDDFMESLDTTYPNHPEQCTEALVSHLLIYDNLPSYEKKGEHGNVRQKCGCFFEYGIVTGVNSALNWISNVEESVATILSCLIKKGKEGSQLAVEWIYFIVGSVLGLHNICSPSSLCTNPLHALKFDEGKLQGEWKKVTLELMVAETEWGADIASKLMECSETDFTDKQKEKLKKLLSLLKSNSEESKESSASKSVEEPMHTVDDVVEAAHAQSSSMGNTVEELKNSILSRDIDISGDSPLGILPHQKGNPKFYKDLILDFPEIELTQANLLKMPIL